MLFQIVEKIADCGGMQTKASAIDFVGVTKSFDAQTLKLCKNEVKWQKRKQKHMGRPKK